MGKNFARQAFIIEGPDRFSFLTSIGVSITMPGEVLKAALEFKLKRNGLVWKEKIFIEGIKRDPTDGFGLSFKFEGFIPDKEIPVTGYYHTSIGDASKNLISGEVIFTEKKEEENI